MISLLFNARQKDIKMAVANDHPVAHLKNKKGTLPRPARLAPRGGLALYQALLDQGVPRRLEDVQSE